MQNTKKNDADASFFCAKNADFLRYFDVFLSLLCGISCVFRTFFRRLINVRQVFSGFFSVFGAGDKFLSFCTGEEEYAQRYAKGKQFRRRCGEPKPRHFP